MTLETFQVSGYLLYLSLAVTLTVWVARTLHKNGRVFLVEAFHGDEKLADSVNHLLVVGFYLINIGFVSLALRLCLAPGTWGEVIVYVSTKVGSVMIVLGAMHFFNLYTFSRMRRRALLRNARPPVLPTDHVAPAPGWSL